MVLINSLVKALSALILLGILIFQMVDTPHISN